MTDQSVPAEPEQPGIDRLAEAVRQRREQLKLRQNDLESRGGPSGATVRNIEQAAKDKYAPRTYRQIDDALRWPPGTAAKLIVGENDVPAKPDRTRTSGSPWSQIEKLVGREHCTPASTVDAVRYLVEQRDALRGDIAARQEEKEIQLHIQDEYSTMLRRMARRSVHWRRYWNGAVSLGRTGWANQETRHKADIARLATATGLAEDADAGVDEIEAEIGRLRAGWDAALTAFEMEHNARVAAEAEVARLRAENDELRWTLGMGEDGGGSDDG